MPKDLSGRTVLIVDDEPGLRKLLKIEFESCNAEVTLAEDGRKAMDFLREKDFDILLTDMKMPDYDGMWLITHALEELEPIPKIYVCSGYNDYSQDELEMLGVIKTFAKPFEFMSVAKEVISSCGLD